MHYLMIVLRFLHVFAGAFWFGGAMLMSFFISPTVAATAEAGQRFMGHLLNKIRIHVIFTVAASLSILAGVGLYWIDSDGFVSAWTRSGPGIVFGIGGVFGLIGYIFGLLLGKNLSILASIGAKAQGKPTPEQLSQIQAAQKQLKVVGPVSSFSLIIAVACMSVARYWF